MRARPKQFASFLALSALLFSLFIGYQILAICASAIVGSSTVRSAHPYTGSWWPDILDAEHMMNTSLFPPVNDFHSVMSFRSFAYAGNCYEDDAKADGCARFSQPRLPYKEEHRALCPFVDTSMCLEGPHMAYRLDTGFLDSYVLGIIEESRVRFRLQKTCAPLVADGRYVRSVTIDDLGTRYVEYHYGDGWGIMQDGNKTLGEIVRDPMLLPEDIPRYSIRSVKLLFCSLVS
ncbi:hypothetical protein K491DRAFT_30135 [Lophiostoma macrostomum CBS 122681]|uniref:Uncharacterized protein n=1 Tax=Lophiostoma macrostomum CBS 122681 TaxID=1314788 RepID=A0A6A6SYI6_9PLEO|nr:hypothetical protein K491DRAFT_30135 [Lophiostoma macrostomum CBS 122681]